MAARPLVTVYNVDGKETEQVRLPDVFKTPIRHDIVQVTQSNMAKNRRHPYAVSTKAGHQTSAESWGTGRAVARIPRVPGGGTHRAGQGAFGNMCRGGRMFAPTKTYRKWHVRTNVNQKRFAVCSALAASAIPSLVMARGHKIENISEIPLVISGTTLGDLDKTKKAVSLLKQLHAWEDVQKVKDSKRLRAGKGKMRNRRYVQRQGPLLVYAAKGPFVKALRNLPGFESADVSELNLLKLAPGGHLGRFIIWTKDAFQKLDHVFGTFNAPSVQKRDYRLPRSIITNPDLGRIINSDEIQSHLRPVKKAVKYVRIKKNALKNPGVLARLNPYAIHQRRVQLLHEKEVRENKEKFLALKKQIWKKRRVAAKKRRPVVL